MTVDELINLIKEVPFLKDIEKEKWLNLIPKMNDEQLKEFAGIILFGQKQREKLYREKTVAIAGVQEIFAALNNYAASKARKEVPKMLEQKLHKEEEIGLDKLLKELENE